MLSFGKCVKSSIDLVVCICFILSQLSSLFVHFQFVIYCSNKVPGKKRIIVQNRSHLNHLSTKKQYETTLLQISASQEVNWLR